MAPNQKRPDQPENLLDEETKYAISDLDEESTGTEAAPGARSGLVSELPERSETETEAVDADAPDRILRGNHRYDSPGETELSGTEEIGSEPTHRLDPDRVPNKEHTVVLDSQQLGDTQTVPTAQMPQGPSGGGAQDDVFVILPEGADGSIPMVDTEEFEDGVTEMVEDSEVFSGSRQTAEATGMTTFLGDDPAEAPTGELTEYVEPHDSFDELTDLDGAEPTEVLGDDFDELATSLDDEELLSGDAGGESLSAGEDWDDEDFGEGSGASRSASGTFFRALLTVAAIGVVSLAGYYYFVDPELFGLLPGRGTAVATTGGTVDQPGQPDGHSPGQPVGGQDPVVVGQPGDGSPVDMGTDPLSPGGTSGEVRETLRKSVLLSLRLGFTGEVAYE